MRKIKNKTDLKAMYRVHRKLLKRCLKMQLDIVAIELKIKKFLKKENLIRSEDC